MSNLKINFSFKGRNADYIIHSNTSIQQLRNHCAKLFKIPHDQLSLTCMTSGSEKIVLDQEEKRSLNELGIEEPWTFVIKDLGKQIKWEYVFYIEYLGPILIIPLFYFLGKKDKYTLVQHTAAIMGVAHFLKRQLQTKFVHIFSRKTMPFHRVFINSAHYWVLFGFLNSLQLFLFPKEMKWDSNEVMILFIIWAVMQFCNYKCHKQLSSFRKANKKSVGIPKTYGFKYVACANYLWETLGWLTFSILTKCYSSFLFTGVSAAQMTSWALKKQKEYKRKFNQGYPKQRKAIIPFIL